MLEREELQHIQAEEAERLAQGLPPDPVLVRRRGAVLGVLRSYESALAAFDEAERIRTEQGLPVDPAIDINRGCALRDLGHPGEAIAALERAEAQYAQLGQPPHPALAVNLGGVLRNLGRADESLLEYDKALKQSVDMAIEPHFTIYMNRGVALYTLGRVDEAMAAYDEAEKQRERLGFPPDPVLITNRASVLDFRGDHDAALKLYDEAERLCTERGMAQLPNIALNRGHSLLAMGRRDEALDQFNECIWRYGRLGAEVPLFVRQRIEDIQKGGDGETPEGVLLEEARAPGSALPPPNLHASARQRLDAFLSHRRRDGGPYARLIKLNFEIRGRHAFLDVDEKQPSSRFDERLLSAIEGAGSFVLLLTPGALDRCANEGDWLRLEIRHALGLNKTIIPVMLPEFRWPAPEALPEDIRGVTLCEGLSYSHDYFPAFMDMLVKWCARDVAAAA